MTSELIWECCQTRTRSVSLATSSEWKEGNVTSILLVNVSHHPFSPPMTTKEARPSYKAEISCMSASEGRLKTVVVPPPWLMFPLQSESFVSLFLSPPIIASLLTEKSDEHLLLARSFTLSSSTDVQIKERRDLAKAQKMGDQVKSCGVHFGSYCISDKN